VESLRGNSALEAAFAASLELLNIPFTGSGSIALTLCHNKGTAKAILRSNGIKTPRYCIFGLGDNNFCLNNFPVIVKPLHEDGSLGITAESVVRNNSELWDRVINIRKNYGQEALVEEYIEGREFGIGVISFNGSNRAFPVSEIVFDGYPEDLPRIVSFNAKWNEDVPEYKKSVPHCPADISWNLSRRLKNTGLKVFKVFGLRGYCRIDVRVRNNKIYVLDVNGNPDIAPGSGVHTILNASKVSYTEFIQQLIEGALRGK
jgi:D-alanine-D-alanine ligase